MTLPGWMPFARRRQAHTSVGAVAPALAGVAAGAAAIVLLEPRGGARRRARIVQKAVHEGRALESFGEKAARDLANRSRGLLASARSRVRADAAPPEVLCERVRARLGRLTSHAGAIEVSAREGVVELRGAVLEAEAERVVEGVGRVRGVGEVTDLLERHAEPGRVPRLQGGDRAAGPAAEPLQGSWSPGVRLLALASGAALVLGGMRSRRPAAVALAAVGALLALRGASDLPLRRLVGVGARERAARVTRDELRPPRARA